MTFYEARAFSRLGMHVRRDGWADKWFILWRGVWWCMGAAYRRVALATDYGVADLQATDWTTMPAALTGCVIDPGSGSTGGGPPTVPPGGPSGPPGGPGGGSVPPPTAPPGFPPFIPPSSPLPPGAPTPRPPHPPRPPSSCVLGSASLTAIQDGSSINVELTVSGASTGNYSVRYSAALSSVLGGLHAGPSFTDSAVVPIDDSHLWQRVTVVATITGFAGGPCQGFQGQVQATVDVVTGDCAPSYRPLVASIAGVTGLAGGMPADHGTPDGSHVLRWSPTDFAWVTSFISSGTGPENLWTISGSCSGGFYELSVVSGLYGPVGGGALALGGSVALDANFNFTHGSGSLDLGHPF